MSGPDTITIIEPAPALSIEEEAPTLDLIGVGQPSDVTPAAALARDQAQAASVTARQQAALAIQAATDAATSLAGAQSAETDAVTAAAEARLAAAQATAVAQQYPDIASGLAATTDGEFFGVVVSGPSDTYQILYQNVAGAAVERNRLASLTGVQGVLDTVRGGVASGGDTLAKLYTALTGVQQHISKQGVDPTEGPYGCDATSGTDPTGANHDALAQAVADALSAGLPLIVPPKARIGLGAQMVFPDGIRWSGLAGAALVRDYTDPGRPLITQADLTGNITAEIYGLHWDANPGMEGAGIALNLQDSILFDARHLRSYGLGIAFAMGLYRTQVVWPRIANMPAAFGSGGFRVLHGKDSDIWGLSGPSGDDFAQMVLSANPVSPGFNKPIDNVWFHGPRGSSQVARAFVAAVDESNSASITRSGWRQGDGAGQGTGFGVLIESKSFYAYGVVGSRDGATATVGLGSLTKRGFRPFQAGEVLTLFGSADATWNRTVTATAAGGATTGSAGLTFNAGAGTIALDAGTWTGKGFGVGDYVMPFGAASANAGKRFLIASLSGLTATVTTTVDGAMTSETLAGQSGLWVSNGITVRFADTGAAGAAPANLMAKRANPATVDVCMDVQVDDSGSTAASAVRIHGPVKVAGHIHVTAQRLILARIYGGVLDLRDLKLSNDAAPTGGTSPCLLIKDLFNSRPTLDVYAPPAAPAVKFDVIALTDDEGAGQDSPSAFAVNSGVRGVIRDIPAGQWGLRVINGAVICDDLRLIEKAGQVTRALGVYYGPGTSGRVRTVDFTGLPTTLTTQQLSIDAAASVIVERNNPGLVPTGWPALPALTGSPYQPPAAPFSSLFSVRGGTVGNISIGPDLANLSLLYAGSSARVFEVPAGWRASIEYTVAPIVSRIPLP